jgi:hypothetical protein
LGWTLLNSGSVTVTAEAEGVIITHGQGSRSSTVSRFERILPALLLQLEDMEIGSKQSETSWCIPYTEFAELESREIDAFENLCKWSPFTLELESTRWLGAADFRYQYRFFQGRSPIPIERRGCFVSAHNDLFRLDADSFNLLEAIDGFNVAPSADRASSALLQFSRIKGLATSVGAKLDKYLSAERVLLPSKLGVDIVAEEGGRISFVPKVEGVPQDALTSAFFAADDIESVYAVDDPAGGRIRVIFDNTQQEVLRRIQRVRHLGGQSKAKVMRDPSAVFDGLSGAMEFAFGPRVTGVGDFPFAVRPYVDARTGIFDGLPPVAPRTPEYGLECRYTDGTCERVRFSSRQELLQFRNHVADARSRGVGTVEMNARTISVDSALESSLDELLRDDGSRPMRPEEPKRSGQYVLILTNETQVDYQEVDGSNETNHILNVPTAFDAEAKPHQTIGFQWLRKNYDRNRSGCLLADDMGLGKTLQVLLFLASLIESGDLSDKQDGNGNLPPWNPILVIAPVILIENATWESDMRSFFRAEGAVFEPLLVLHGPLVGETECTSHSEPAEDYLLRLRAPNIPKLVISAWLYSAKLAEKEKKITDAHSFIFQFSLCSFALSEDSPPTRRTTNRLGIEVWIEMHAAGIRQPISRQVFNNLSEMTEFLSRTRNLTVTELRLPRNWQARHRPVRKDRAGHSAVLAVETLATEDNSHVASKAVAQSE